MASCILYTAADRPAFSANAHSIFATKVSSRDAKQAISQLFRLAQTRSEITDNSLSLTAKSWLDNTKRQKNVVTNVTSLNRKNVVKLTNVYYHIELQGFRAVTVRILA